MLKSFSSLNVLIAYPYFSKQVFEYLKTKDPAEYRLMIDSGAFTAYKSGEPICLDDYCKFLDMLQPLRPFQAVQLDEIGNHDQTLKNYEIMKSRGYDVLPVFTRGSPIELLDYLFTQTDYVLIGGVAVGEGRQGYVKYLAPHVNGRKIHILGFTDLRFIKALKPYSVDSSGWNSGGRYGRLCFYQGLGSFTMLNRKQTFKLGFTQLCQFAHKSGLKAEQVSLLKEPEAWNGGMPHLCSKGTVYWLGAYAYVAQAQEIEQHLNTRSYLAVSSDLQLKMVYNSYDLYRKNYS